MGRRVLPGPRKLRLPAFSSPLLGRIIALLARAAGRLGRVYRKLIIRQSVSLGGPAWIATRLGVRNRALRAEAGDALGEVSVSVRPSRRRNTVFRILRRTFSRVP
ncbi:hypothetical protein EYF80_033040 [Liparis tanakae]|uniref:Uncharacterized protein n=1 Tax=Liparis tanakae TaxID=230148 RepID=A0A4Z2GVL1_9TELE|nr:hypothetical protein EYF80_033040 [Liparis tanakae]